MSDRCRKCGYIECACPEPIKASALAPESLEDMSEDERIRMNSVDPCEPECVATAPHVGKCRIPSDLDGPAPSEVESEGKTAQQIEVGRLVDEWLSWVCRGLDRFIHWNEDNTIVTWLELPFEERRKWCCAASIIPTPREDAGPRCDTCGAPHWYNFFVPDDVWEKIAPLDYVPGGGGTLCVLCIDKRCAELGIQTTGRFHFTGNALSVPRPDAGAGERIRKAVKTLAVVHMAVLKHHERYADTDTEYNDLRVAVKEFMADYSALSGSSDKAEPVGSGRTHPSPGTKRGGVKDPPASRTTPEAVSWERRVEFGWVKCSKELHDRLIAEEPEYNPARALYTRPPATGERGERIEGCQVGTTFIEEFEGGYFVEVKLPEGGTLHEILGKRCALVVPGQIESPDPLNPASVSDEGAVSEDAHEAHQEAMKDAESH